MTKSLIDSLKLDSNMPATHTYSVTVGHIYRTLDGLEEMKANKNYIFISIYVFEEHVASMQRELEAMRKSSIAFDRNHEKVRSGKSVD